MFLYQKQVCNYFAFLQFLFKVSVSAEADIGIDFVLQGMYFAFSVW